MSILHDNSSDVPSYVCTKDPMWIFVKEGDSGKSI